MKGSWPLMTGTSDRANSSSSVNLTLSRSMAESSAKGTHPSKMIREFGIPIPPAKEVCGDKR